MHAIQVKEVEFMPPQPSTASEEPPEARQNPPQGSQEPTSSEPVWTYRGYKLRASEFTTAMVHFFRAEVSRANVWRARLDTTTNWAVLTTGAAISFAFTQVQSNHIVMPLNLILVTMFLVIEARRYRYYELWSYRVRLMETDFFASMLVPPFQPSPDWAEALSENLLHPHFPISNWEAIGRRLRLNYLWIYIVIGSAWLAKLWLVPATAKNMKEFYSRASVGALPGELVILIALLFFTSMLVFSLATIGLHQSAGEVLPRYGEMAESIAAGISAVGKGPSNVRAWFRPTARRRQMLTYIITDKAQEVSQRILKEMARGVTSLAGTGMFTGSSHSILMCALTLTEIAHLKNLVREEDPNAFVIVTPAEQVFGKGFLPLQAEWD